jgi:YHS domain-containing protein
MTYKAATLPELTLDNCTNETCPWSGKPVSSDSLTYYQGHVVGFCNPGCKDKFEAATKAFDTCLEGI